MNKHPLLEKTADRFENALSGVIKHTSMEAPLLEEGGDMEDHKWYRVHLPKGLSGDGSEYHIYIKKGDDAKNGPLCIFFSGGGIAYDEKTAQSPATAGRVLTGDGGYYWNNLRPITQIMNIGTGITDLNKHINPFYDWNFIVIAYSTGDFHVGDSEFIYKDADGHESTLYFHGYKNYTEAMKVCTEHFPNPERLLIAGDSAGGFAVTALSADICNNWYKNSERITMFSDSAFLEKDDWRHTIEDLWKSPKTIYSRIEGKSLSTEWYRKLYEDLGERATYLLAGSPRDHLLSSFRNDILNGEYVTDAAIQKEYRAACKNMLREVKEINPNTGFFIYNWRNRIYPGGGTVHTAVRTPFFYIPIAKKLTMAKWLADSVL